MDPQRAHLTNPAPNQAGLGTSMKFLCVQLHQHHRGGKKEGKKMDLQGQRVFFHLYASTSLMEGALEKTALSIFQGKGDQGEGMTVPV